MKENIINIDENSQNNKINELFSYIQEKNKDKDINNIKIFQQYISQPNILKTQSYLISFIEQLKKQLELGNNIIVPFLNLCPILIKEYIESELDEDEGKDLKYIEIFKLLKINSFISREYLYPIYEYCTEIFYFMNNMDEKDKKFKKFNKVFELWKIFYDFNIDNNIKNIDINSSSYCFSGGSLLIKTRNKIILNEPLIIEINFSKNNFFDFNKNLLLISIKKKNYTIKYNQLENLLKSHTDGRRVHYRHAEQHRPQQRADKAYDRRVLPSAEETAEQDRYVHGREHFADLRDLSRNERQELPQSQKHGCQRHIDDSFPGSGTCIHIIPPPNNLRVRRRSWPAGGCR